MAFPCHCHSSPAPPTLPQRPPPAASLPLRCPCLPLRHGAPASNFATAPRPVSSSAAAPPASSIFPMALRCSAQASNIFQMALRRCVPAGQQLRRGAPASNKPHLAEKSTPVWLAIWRTWAGFANSQLRRAALRCIYLYICANPHCFHLETAAQTDANLSAHLHRLPTPPPYLRQMRLSHGQGAGVVCWIWL